MHRGKEQFFGGLPDEGWAKSSFSNGNGDCVEVADLGSRVGMRDSKQSDGAVVTASGDGWLAFIGSVTTGTLSN
ncbi:DUF397 domain-containing protein [Streptomyces sp. RFCAC02]|uniref:DUF397 domain-containing protein n=1 Tax=Streptomyces sp. RFCAC02 TaxID=2499143 RepID=UPI0010201EEF|nr:DUF397 domain-containing protein [Streptomyces sp. RFCAC02]